MTTIGAAGWLIPVLLAGSVGLLAFFLCSSLFEARRIRQRYSLPTPIGTNPRSSQSRPQARSGLGLDAASLGLTSIAQRELRTKLIRAGYFSPGAPVVYTIIRAILAVAVPLAAYVFIYWNLSDWTGLAKLAMTLGAFLTAYYLGPAYLDRRQRLMETEYRLFFPDFLDMLVVCVDAGLSLEAALERVAQEIDDSQAAFRTNLELMMAETRAGKTTIEALRDFARRLGLSEAGSLVTLLQQSLELGTDISSSLAIFSDEMRDKRISRAEERAFALPVKMTIPLALFILPTIFIAIMTPAVMKIASSLGSLLHANH